MRQHRWYRVLRFVLVALLGVELCYVVVANAALNLGGVQKALSSTDDIRASFDTAWTVWPGRVHVQNVRVLFHDHNLEWSLDLASVDVDVAFLPFFSKTLHATRVRGEGAAFRMRQRCRPIAAGAESGGRVGSCVPPAEETAE